MQDNMSRLSGVFEACKEDRRLALLPYLTVGYPSLQATLDLAPALAEAGADALELGIPFSDPVADGPTIQRSTYQALQSGVTPETCLEVAGRLRAAISTPLLFMTYLNPILRYGAERFLNDARDAGVDGLIVPDLPAEESEGVSGLCGDRNLDLIQFMAPTSSESRLEVISSQSSGFIYCVSLTGVTGARARLSQTLPEFLSRVRRHSSLPRVVGFGISRPEHVAALHDIAEGAIVASGLIDVIDRADKGKAMIEATRYVAKMKAMTKPAPAG